jgi:hypothetical protein
VIEATYGGSIVVLPSDGPVPASGVLPAHHHLHAH